MKNQNAWTVLVIALMFSARALSQSPPPERAVAALDFLAGSWSGSVQGGEFVAYYATPEGGKVLSYSELRKDGEVAFFEFEKFDIQGGHVVFTPYPGGKPAIPLKLAELDAERRRAVFENPEKDFPTRIVYHRVSPDNLVITLSNAHGGGPVEKFDLRRVP